MTGVPKKDSGKHWPHREDQIVPHEENSDICLSIIQFNPWPLTEANYLTCKNTSAEVSNQGKAF